jgi:tagatose-6-phosphate ketose/aldose isomerase
MTTVPGVITHAEISHQPDLWPDTVRRVRSAAFPTSGAAAPAIEEVEDERPVLTGAGSSAYAATAIAAAWPGARAIPTTDLLLDARSGGVPELPQGGLLISIARSGDSPESVGVVEVIQRVRPDVRHLAIMCNERGQLAKTTGVSAILLDPRTNDRSLAVTSAYSNLVLAGLTLRHGNRLEESVAAVSARTRAALAALDASARAVAEHPASRVTVLTPPALVGAAREASLKVLEMTDGAVVSMAETFVGVRHGPMTFLRDNELVLCLLSSDMHLRRYEEDLLFELRAKKLGRIVAVASAPLDRSLADHLVSANAPDLPDMLRTPFEIVFPQLLAYHLSLKLGLNPDAASPRGVINRVVQGVRVHH